MSHSTLVAAITLTLVTLSASRVPSRALPSNGFVVHEWGTFTSIAGPDGTAVEWTPLAGPQDLPCFVDRLRFNIKGWMPGTVRMETPVLYFYAGQAMKADVSVRFGHGVVTEWYPRAVVTPATVTSTDMKRSSFASSIVWHDVHVAPDTADTADRAAGLRVERRPSHYYAARNVDASLLQSGAQQEKFLFYRGIGAFEPPLTAVVDRSGKVVVTRPDGESVGDLILFENRGGAVAYEIQHARSSIVTFDPLSVDGESAAPLAEIESVLVANGLYPREAAAMVKTWRDSWFEEGTRLFYIAPRAFVDAILRLDITPAPAAVERVFVGRTELITPATEADVRDAIARHDAAALGKYSRFLNAIVGRMLANSTPAERSRAQWLLDARWPSPDGCQ